MNIYKFFKFSFINHTKFIKTGVFKRLNSSLATHSNTNDKNARTPKVIGKTRHFPFATKEWKNSVYAFNKTSLKQSPFNHKSTGDLIKLYFSLNNYKHIARSRRMRGLILRTSSKTILLSRPEIKQTNDKITITIYSYNREKQAMIRNLYFYKRKQGFYNLWLNNYNSKTIKKSKLYASKLYLLSKKSFKTFNRSNKRIPYHNIDFKNETDFLRFRFMNFYKKFFKLNNIFVYLFIKLFLSTFNIQLFKPLNQTSEINKKANSIYIRNIIENKPKLLIVVNRESNKLELIKSDDINLKYLQLVLSEKNIDEIKHHSTIPILNRLDEVKLNNFLLYFVKTKFVNSGMITNKTYFSLYVSMKNRFFKSIILKYFRRKMRWLNHFTKLEMNNLKFNVLLSYLKNFITKIYDKKTELNIVNLKYFHLNSDIYARVVANKFAKKVSALKVLNYCFKSFKLPNRLLIRNKNDSNMNEFNILNTVKSTKLTELNVNSSEYLSKNVIYGKLHYIFDKLFPNSGVHSMYSLEPHAKINTEKNKIVNVLNTLKYKWIKGIKLTVAGRLTRRNTASRALKRFKTKGNLNDAQYYLEWNELRDLSKVILRNNVKANLQYTLAKSKKRTGAFGIKSWISSY